MQDSLVRGGKGDREKAWRFNLVINYNVKESDIYISVVYIKLNHLAILLKLTCYKSTVLQFKFFLKIRD